MKESSFDARRRVIIPGDANTTLEFATKQWCDLAREAIEDHGFFSVALSGGSTPKLIYERLSKENIPWDKVMLFWSDERCVPPTDSESNFHMAMEEGGLKNLGLKKENIFRLEGDQKDLDASAQAYEGIIRKKLNGTFDLVMLGMGEDGHTASLFPHTDALHMIGRLVAPNFVPQKNTWRMTFTFDCINRAKNVIFYILGSSKADIVAKVLTTPFAPDDLPSQRVGTLERPALYLLDDAAAVHLASYFK